VEGNRKRIVLLCPYYSPNNGDLQCRNETVALQGLCKLGNLATIKLVDTSFTQKDTGNTAIERDREHSEARIGHGVESLRFGTGDIVDELRVLWKRGSDEELEDLIVRRFGLLRERASALHERLIREGALVRDQQNLLVWRDERISSETPHKPSGPEPASEDPLVGLEEFYTPYDKVPGLMRCKICGCRFVRSRRDLEVHLDYHMTRGEISGARGK
jgi:hypothetical protein